MLVQLHDDQLIQDLTGKDQVNRDRAMRSVYLEAIPHLKKLVGRYRLGDDKALDLASEGIIKLLHNLKEDRFRGESSLKTYFLSICFGTLMNELRRGNRDVDIEDSSDIHPAFLVETQSSMDDISKLLFCLERLPEFCASVFRLRFWGENGFPMNDDRIASEVNLGSAQAVATKFNRHGCWKLIRDCYFGTN